jgi:hypothetical protein
MGLLQRILMFGVLGLLCGGLIWFLAPGFRKRAVDVYEKYGGWTREARSADPVGFINYAEQKLQSHLVEMQKTSQDLAAAREQIRQATEKTCASLQAADEMAGSFRTAYRQAEAGSSYPVHLEGRDYDRAQLLEQVRLILQQRSDGRRTLSELEQTARVAGEKETGLLAQITRVKAALEILPAQREIVRAGRLTSQTENTWSQVNGLIERDETLLTGSPVRTVDELLRDREARPAGAVGEADVLGFLEGGR